MVVLEVADDPSRWPPGDGIVPLDCLLSEAVRPFAGLGFSILLTPTLRLPRSHCRSSPWSALSHDVFNLRQYYRQRVTAEGTALEGQGTTIYADDLCHSHGHLVPELIFIVGLADTGKKSCAGGPFF